MADQPRVKRKSLHFFADSGRFDRNPVEILTSKLARRAVLGQNLIHMWPAGTKVVCIDDHFPAWARQMYAALPKAGNTYTIRGSTVGVGYGVGFSDRQEGEIAVYLQEIVNPKSGKAPFREWGFKAERFRPLEEDFETNVEEKPEFAPAEKELVSLP